jgi:hypothetical protein
MELVVGLALLAAGIVGLTLARPKGGKHRSFVGTNLEIPIVLSILGMIVVGMVLAILGVVALRS